MARSNFVVDSSVLISFYNSDDTQHEKALNFFEKLTDYSLIIHPYVIQEVSTVLTYRTDISRAQKFLLDTLNSENIFIPNVDTRRDMEYFQKLNKKISFTDSALIRLAKELGAELVTFDKQMMSLLRQK
jgi:predicted nucleic acid-binding protein